jgi:hypothetical protein
MNIIIIFLIFNKSLLFFCSRFFLFSFFLLSFFSSQKWLKNILDDFISLLLEIGVMGGSFVFFSCAYTSRHASCTLNCCRYGRAGK